MTVKTTTTRIPASRITIGDVSEGCTAVNVSNDGDIVVIEWEGNDGKGSCTLPYNPAALVKVTEYDNDEAAAAPVFVKDSAGWHVGVGDEVRIGKHGTGKVLWRIVAIDGDTLHMVDDLTGRNRKADKGQATLSIEGTDAYAQRAAQGLFNIF